MAKRIFALSMTTCFLFIATGCASTNTTQPALPPVTAPTAGQSPGIISETLDVTALGQKLARYVRPGDEQQAQAALNNNQLHQTSAWVSVDSNARIDITPVRVANIPKQPYCRDFLLNIAVQGDKVSAYGTACRQQDGTWKVLS